MTEITPSSLSDTDLLSTTRLAASNERGATARLIALLSEVDARRLYLAEGYCSMFGYCTRSLHMSEQAAYARIEASRLTRRFPKILGRLADGRLSLTNLGLMAPHLTEETSESLLEAVEQRSKREVVELIAALHPQSDVPAMIRALPTRTIVSTAAAEEMPATDGGLPVPDAVPATSITSAVTPAPLVIAVSARRPTVAPGAIGGRRCSRRPLRPRSCSRWVASCSCRGCGDSSTRRRWPRRRCWSSA